MPSTIGDSSLYSFDSLAKSPPLSPEADRASRSSPWRRTSWSRRDSSAASMPSPSAAERLEPRGQLGERHQGLGAAVEIAERRRALGQLVIADQHRRARADPVGAPHASPELAR